MAPSRRRSRSVADLDPESDEQVDRKRVRIRHGANGSGEDEGSTAPGDFQPGSIVRVTVHNFVTYERAEFLPGPNLNMVIGPNGTGKSSLVCAICLGLGYHSNVLGRASSFGEFVKHGKDYATVEIELKRKPRNDVISLRIGRDDNSRQFKLNGQVTTHKAIHELMQKHRIQIDNLCQFLPQDKVAEFAGLSPVELLSKTLQAAAPRDMIENQEKLKEMYAQQKGAQRQIGEESERLRAMETRQQGLQPDVDRLRERDEIERAIKDWEKAHVVVQYQEMRTAHSETKQKKKAAEAKLRRFGESAGPGMETVKLKEEYAARYKDFIHRVLRPRLSREERAAEQLHEDVKAKEEQHDDVQNKRQAELDGLKGKKLEVAECKKKISEYERKMKEPQEPFDAAEWNTKIREREHQSREMDTELRQLEEKIANVARLGKNKSVEAKGIQTQLAQLKTKEGQQLKWLENERPEVAEGVKWLQDNKDLFEKEVFGPPMLTCSVKDDSYSDLVQSQLQADDFLCFVTQSKADHTALSNKFYKDLGLSVSIRTCLGPLSSFKPPLPAAELRRLGLDGFAIDYLDGPEPVLAMLCAEKRLQAHAIGKRELSEGVFDELVQHVDISSFTAGGTSYRINRRREYGGSAVSTTASVVKKGRFWTDQPVDSAQQTQLEQQFTVAKGELLELGNQRKDMQEQKEKLSEDKGKILEDIEDIKAQKNEKQKVFNMYRAFPEKIRLEREKEDQRRAQYDAAVKIIHAHDDDLDSLALEITQAARSYCAQLIKVGDAYDALTDAQLRHAEAESDIMGLKAKNSEVHELLKEGEVVIQNLGREIDRLKHEAKALQDRVRDAMSGLDEEQRDALDELYRGKTAEEVGHELNAQKARLEFVHAANPRVIEEFEQRARDIERLKRQKATREAETRSLGDDIDRIRREWEPRVDELIGEINEAFKENFEQINCAGEVGVHKDEDFDKWAIEIRVKFRENEELQQLDQHRQSGGERSVSTIFYLMSLQSMAQAPFRVVDEINQGMDPRNERMVHERMVEIACDKNKSQYFLITPKLLTGLRYHPRMKVLCIASGPHVPPGNKKVDFRSFVETQRRLAAAAAS